MFLWRKRSLFVLQHLQRIDQARARLARLNHIVNKTGSGRNIGVRKSPPIVFDQLCLTLHRIICIGNVTPLPYQRFTVRLHQSMEAMGERTILDLCSGGTGPLPTIMRLLEQQHGYPVRARMTDLHPNLTWLARR